MHLNGEGAAEAVWTGLSGKCPIAVGECAGRSSRRSDEGRVERSVVDILTPKRLGALCISQVRVTG